MLVHYMKVAIIGTTAFTLYGFRSDLIRTLVGLGHAVYAFAMDYDESSKEKVRGLGAVPVDYRLSRGGLNPFADIATTYMLVRTLKGIKPDLVFSYFAKPIIYGSIAAKIAGVPKIIGMVEGLGYNFTDQQEGIVTKVKMIRNVQVFLYRLAFPCLDTLIFLNHDDPRDLLEKYGLKVNRVVVLGGIGVDLEQYPYSKVNTETIKFLFIGRLLKEKGIYEFVQAAQLVKSQSKEVEFIVLGGVDVDNPGALRSDELNALVASNVITYPGHVSDVVEWIRLSSVFVLPSYREGLPRSTQEAMAIGRAVITTDVPGCRETVIDGVNGFIVPKWSAKEMAEKMIYLIEHPHEIERMGNESHRIAQEKFDASIVNAKLIEIFGI